MANTVIKLKKSSVPSVVPGTLDYGELAINYADGKLFYKDALGSIQEISGGGGGASFSTINVDNSLIVAGAPGSVLGIHAGNNVDLNADVINDILTISANLKPAFDKANAANVLAYDTGIAANNYAGAMANAANSYAASLTPDLSPPFNKANAAYDVANAAYGKANSSNVLAYDTGIGANNYAGAMANSSNGYAVTVGASSNNYAGAMANAGNSWTQTIVDANLVTARAYTNTSTTAANNYAGAMANSGNAYATATYATITTVATNATSANNYAGSMANSSNGYAVTVGSSSNNYAGAMANSSNGYAVTVGASGNAYTNVIYGYVNSSMGFANQSGVIANAAFGAANQAGVVANSVNTYSDSTYVKLTAASQTITGNLSITGNLTLLGGSTIISSNNLSIGDSLIYLAANNYSGTDILDIGFIANYGNTTGANVHTGLIRDATNKQYYLFSAYDAEPVNNSFVPGANNMVNAVLVADINTSNLTLGGANAIVWIKSAYDNSNAAYNNANVGLVSANAYAGAMANSANAYATATYATITTVATNATSANNYAGAMANSSNNYAGVMANNAGTIANAAFAAANAKVETVTSNSTARIWANTVTVNSTETVYVDLATSGVTATIYGGATQIPVITVDAYGRLTAASNVAVNGMDYPYVNTSTAAANAYTNTSTTAANNYLGGLANTGYAAQTMTVTSLSDASGTISWDASTSRMATVTLSGTGRTMANPTNLKAGSYIFICKQDGVGSKTITTWGSAFKWPAAVAPTLSTTASTTDVFSFWCDGTNLYGTYIPDCR